MFVLQFDKESEDRRQRIAQAIRDLTLMDEPQVRDSLAPLADATTVETVEVFPDEIEMDDEKFRGLANIYGVMEFGGDDAFKETFGFPMVFEGRLSEDGVTDLTLKVDTKSVEA